MKLSAAARRALAVLAVSGAAALGGCVANYEIVRYNTAPVFQVHLGCHDTYEVYDRPDAGAMLVGTNVVNEGIAGACADGVASLPLPERLARAARIFLDETSERPQCRITRATPLNVYQTEFNYVCPPPPEKRVAGRPPRR